MATFGTPAAFFRATDSGKIDIFRVGKWWVTSFVDGRDCVLCEGAEIGNRSPRALIERAEQLRNDYFVGQKVTPLPGWRARQGK